MDELTVTFTRKQIDMLIKHVFTGNIVLSSYEQENQDDVADLKNHVLASVSTAIPDSGIVFDDETQAWEFNPERDEELFDLMTDYNEEFFWEELSSRLARRDAIRKMGWDAFSKLDLDRRMALIETEEKKYDREFEANGVDRLELKTGK